MVPSLAPGPDLYSTQSVLAMELARPTTNSQSPRDRVIAAAAGIESEVPKCGDDTRPTLPLQVSQDLCFSLLQKRDLNYNNI